MKKLFLLLFLFSFLNGNSQSISFIDEIRFAEDFHGGNTDSTGGSDCWGWTDPLGNDYAIMGTYYGTHYVKIPDMTVLDSVFGAQLNDYWYHRDIKTWRNYAFIVGEMRGPECGMQVVDLSFLPDSVHHVVTYKTVLDSVSHNLSIDTANARAYVLKSDYSGVRIIDISNPAMPLDIGYINSGNIHDVYARNDTAWIAEGYEKAFSVWDCSDPSNPSMLGMVSDVNFGYCHNIWASPDGKYFATAEETPEKTVKIWDMADVLNITLVGQYLASCELVHNAHWIDNFLVLSHYQSGIAVVNVANPANPIEVGIYDNYPWGDTSQFRGCWGAFPFTANGYIYGSTIEGRLTLLGFNPLALEKEAFEKTRLLSTPFPNPSNGNIDFALQMRNPGYAKISISNILGNSIFELKDANYPAGETKLNWHAGNDVVPGVYFIRAESEGIADSRIIVIQ